MRVAVWGAFDAGGGELLASRRMLEEGLRRRLPGCEVTALSAQGLERAVDGGRPPETRPGPAELAARFDCVISIGDVEALRTTLPVVSAGPDSGVLPPLALLLPRRLDPGLLRRRADFLRLMGWAWPSGRVLSIEGDATLLPLADDLAAALRPLVESGVAVQLCASRGEGGGETFADALDAALPGSCRRIPAEATIEDRVAVVAASTAHVGSPGLGLWSAVALGVPAAAAPVAAAGELDGLLAGVGVSRPTAAGLGGAVAALLAGDPERPSAAAALDGLERHLDGLAELVRGAAPPGRHRSDGAAGLTHEERLDALRRAHEVRGLQLVAERHGAQAVLDAALAGARAELDRLRSELAAARAANDRMVASRTWRYTQPVRDALARLRERRR